MKDSKVQRLARLIVARVNCIDNDNGNWADQHEVGIEMILATLPAGSGIDSGNEVDYDKSSINRIVINSSFHVMNDQGGYDGWIDYRVIITASLMFGFDVNIVGNFSSNKNAHGLKDSLVDLYSDSLSDI